MQSDDARKGLFAPLPMPLDQVLTDFRLWFGKHEPVFVWSHGSTFDLPILEEAWRVSMPGTMPYKYKNVRDTRTLSWLARHAGWDDATPRPEMLTKHDALSDCLYQIRQVQEAFRYLQKGA